MHLIFNGTGRQQKIALVSILVIAFALMLDIFFSYTFSVCDMQHPSMARGSWSMRFVGQESKREIEALNNRIVEPEWVQISQVGKSYPVNSKGIFYYKTILPDTHLGDPSILFQTNDHAFRIFLNNQVIYTYGNFDQFDYKHSPGSPTHLIALPEDYAKGELIIAMKSVSPDRAGLIRSIEFDTKSNHIIRIFKMNIGTLILACLDVLIGTACMFIGATRKLGRRALFSLGFSFIVVGVWSISENSLTQVFHIRPAFWYTVAIVSFYFIPISIYLFLGDISQNQRKLFHLLIKLHIINFISCFFLDLLGLVPFIKTLVLHYILMSATYLVSIIAGIISYRKGYKETLIYSLGLLLFGLFGLYDVAGWYFEAFPWRINLTPWGMFIFQLGLIYLLIKYLQEMQERFNFYKERIKNKEDKLREKEEQINKVMEYDKIRTEFFANISHELRTPLNIISSTVQLIKMYQNRGAITSSEINLDKYLGMINQNSNRLLKLVNNIIDITKIEAGFYKLEFKETNIVSVIENITMSIEEYAKLKGIELIFDTNVEERIILCDPDSIERIMLNLLSNAIKFSKENGQIKVVIEDDEDSIRISVEDDGIGIPKEHLCYIFDRFIQVDKSFTRQQEGSGIGLTLVKFLVELHKGKIQVESEVDEGSKFTICLPAEKFEDKTEKECLEGYHIGDNSIEKVSVEFSDVL